MRGCSTRCAWPRAPRAARGRARWPLPGVAALKRTSEGAAPRQRRTLVCNLGESALLRASRAVLSTAPSSGDRAPQRNHHRKDPGRGPAPATRHALHAGLFCPSIYPKTGLSPTRCSTRARRNREIREPGRNFSATMRSFGLWGSYMHTTCKPHTKHTLAHNMHNFSHSSHASSGSIGLLARASSEGTSSSSVGFFSSHGASKAKRTLVRNDPRSNGEHAGSNIGA